MAITIRLMRFGKRGNPFYRIVALDKRKKRDGQYLDLLGTYDPMTKPSTIKLNDSKMQNWINKGAQLSDGLHRLLKKKST
jgi:small subunit ribosomal protein S16